jgi:hypothetical protein
MLCNTGSKIKNGCTLYDIRNGHKKASEVKVVALDVLHFTVHKKIIKICHMAAKYKRYSVNMLEDPADSNMP